MLLRSFTIMVLLLLALFSGHSAAYHSNEQALFGHVEHAPYFLPSAQSAANERGEILCSADTPSSDNDKVAVAPVLRMLPQATQYSLSVHASQSSWEFVSLAAHLIRGPPSYF